MPELLVNFYQRLFQIKWGCMSKSTASLLAQEWRNAILYYSEEVRSTVKHIAVENKKELAAFFYEEMVQNAAAKLFLSNEAVHERLMPSMQNWLTQLFSVTIEADFVELIALQKKVGEVHARIDLPMHLVLHGARTLKHKFTLLLEKNNDLSLDHKAESLRLISDSLDIAMEVMSQAYASSYDRKARAEESYRLFSAVLNAAAEKGRQRAALLDWENELMFALSIDDGTSRIMFVRQSDFGLWFYHKGMYAFDNLPETKIILSSIEVIDKIIKKLKFQIKKNEITSKDRIEFLKQIRIESRNIQLNMDTLFDMYNDLEAGRDELTRLLSRKYLPVVLSKEVSYSRKRGITFALLAIDIDFFKRINDAHGHAAGDMVLQQFSELLANRSRAGDYVFRLGGEEFLVLLVDITKSSAVRVANQLRQKISEELFSLSDGKMLSITASIGVTLFDGHPDYTRTLNRADEALYEAKESGRNKVVYLPH